MEEATQEIKTLDYPQSDKFLPKEEIRLTESVEIENPFSASPRCNGNPGGSTKIEDAQILKFLGQSVQGCVGSGIEDAYLPKAPQKPSQDETEDVHIPKTPEKTPLDDTLLFETLEKPRPDEIDDALLMESLLDSIEAPQGRDERSLGESMSELDPIQDPSSEFLGGWPSPRSNQPESSWGSALRKRKRSPSWSSNAQTSNMGNCSGVLSGIGDPSFMNGNINFAVKDTEVAPFSTQRWNEPEACPVGAGLANLGNTCFLNAILQCFTHTVPLVQGLLSFMHEKSSHGEVEFCVLCAVRDQIQLSLTHSGGVISPSTLVDNLSQISSFFRRYQQEDAHEFLQCLLDKFDSNWSKYERNAKDSLSKDSLVKQIFGGRLVSEVCCRKCGHNSDTYEPLIDLSLEIENVENLESALKSFTKVESIEETEKFTCEGCKEQVPVEKQLILDRAPSVAALHLKRFKSDGIYVEKIDKKVEYPLELDLKPYAKGAKDGNEELKYELFAVVVHVGLSSTSGHYFCYVRTAPDAWYRFDDSKVIRVLEATALSQDAYILFYARKGTEWFSDFFEKWKAVFEQKRPNTSPKSVLDEMDLPSTSTCLGAALLSCEAAEKRDAVAGASDEHSGGLMPDPNSMVNTQHSEPANRMSVPSSTEHFHDKVKTDRSDFDYTIRINGESCSLSCVERTVDIDPSTPPQSHSPDVYSDEEPAETKYLIPVDNLKVAHKAASAKKSMDKAKDDVKRKEAARYMSKSMPSSRRQSLMAAMMGPQSDSSLNKKRRKQTAAFLHERHSPKKRFKISPKRVLGHAVA